MPKSEKVNKLEKPAPEKEQVGNGSGEKDEGELSVKKELNLEELEIAIKKNQLKEEPEQETEEEDETEKESWEQKYDNLRKLQSSQTEELGELRKFRKETEEEKVKFKDYQTNATKDHILRQVEEMKPEERDQFIELFSESPDKALRPIISKMMSPFLIIQANHKNQMEVDKLKKDTANKLVPYDEEEVNKILNSFTKNGRNSLFDKHGSGAFKEAYNMYRDANYEDAMTKKEEEITRKAEEKADKATNKKKNAFTEPPGESSASQIGKEKIDYNSMEPEVAVAKLEKKLGFFKK